MLYLKLKLPPLQYLRCLQTLIPAQCHQYQTKFVDLYILALRNDKAHRQYYVYPSRLFCYLVCWQKTDRCLTVRI